jgi:hypothetical protein
MKPLTPEQHLSNILLALKKSTLTFEEHDIVKDSFNAIVKIVTEPKEEKTKEERPSTTELIPLV